VPGGILDGQAMIVPLYGPPIFKPVELGAMPALAPPAIPPQVADTASGDPRSPATAPAPSGDAANPARAPGEPAMNGDYWLNYFYNIPRFFTAPARFDTEDWIKFGAFVAAVGGAYALDTKANRFFHDNRSNASDGLAAVGYRLGDSKTIVAGAAAGYALGYALDDRRARETALLVLQTWGLGALGSEGLKRLIGRERPSSNKNHDDFDFLGGNDKSFPSGHAVNAFGVASVLAEQYDDVAWAAPAAYAVAGLVAWSRLNDNAHWLSDVAFGAGLGYAVGKIVTHFSPFRDNPDLSVSPMGLPGGGGVVLGFRY
jgi:membrane-associated phospholipid phosphatase